MRNYYFLQENTPKSLTVENGKLRSWKCVYTS